MTNRRFVKWPLHTQRQTHLVRQHPQHRGRGDNGETNSSKRYNVNRQSQASLPFSFQAIKIGSSWSRSLTHHLLHSNIEMITFGREAVGLWRAGAGLEPMMLRGIWMSLLDVFFVSSFSTFQRCCSLHFQKVKRTKAGRGGRFTQSRADERR